MNSSVQAVSQVSRFGGAKYVFRVARFCFYYTYKTNFSGHNKMWDAQKMMVVDVLSCLGQHAVDLQEGPLERNFTRRYEDRYRKPLSLASAALVETCMVITNRNMINSYDTKI